MLYVCNNTNTSSDLPTTKLIKRMNHDRKKNMGVREEMQNKRRF